MPSDKAHVLDKIKTWVSVVALIVTVGGGSVGLYVQGQKNVAQLEERVNTLVQSNERNYEVFDKLADSVDRLSVSVARLDERTRALENY